MRLITRGDMDGLTCAVLITETEQIDAIELIHPQDITDRKFDVRKGDILANLPYHPDCSKWFDHHILTESNSKPPEKFDGLYRQAPSTARVICEYYKDAKLHRFEELVSETDRMDSAQLTMDDVLDPKGFILLGYTIDPRTGLGSFKEYFLELVDALKKNSIEGILQLPEVKRRIELMKTEWEQFERLTLERSTVKGNVIVTDLRDVERIPIGNRFLVYTLFPGANVSLRIHRGPQGKSVAVVVGHAIFNRTCKVNVGELMSDYGGGGHFGAGSALLKLDTAEQDLKNIINKLNAD